jgi:hypothetical protein
MAFAEGAWVLLEKSVAAKDISMRTRIAQALRTAGFRLHDIDRRGEKGFTRIAPGFCTTPTSEAMAMHFNAQGDVETAAIFHWSSMEFIQSESPEATIMVTELPVFSLSGGYGARSQLPQTLPKTSPKPGTTNYEKFRDSLKQLIAVEDYSGAVDLGRQYDLQPVPFEVQCRTQLELVKIAAGVTS